MESTMGGVVEDVGENGSSSEQRSLGVVDVDAERVNEGASILLRAGRGDLGLEVRDGLGNRGLEMVNDGVGLLSAS